MRYYKTINAIACDQTCANGFKTDRKCGLIYGPYKFDNGQFAMSWEQASRRDFFCAYCGPGQPAKLEIMVNGNWAEVSPSIFRSWTGKRRMDGRKYIGPRFVFGTFNPIPDTQKTED